MENHNDRRGYDGVVFYAAVLGGRELRAGRRREHDVYEIGGSRA